MNEWPLTHEERSELCKRLSQNISMADLLSKYSSAVKTVYAKDFTHVCICPNPAHSQGSEKTASFYFSETNKTFHCFGCKFHGNIFDLIGRMQGIPADFLISQYAKKENMSLEDLPEPPKTFPILDLNFELSIKLRDYLVELKNSPNYEVEKKWVDGVFVRIDERFLKLTDRDYEAARMFYMQVQLELERRKN